MPFDYKLTFQVMFQTIAFVFSFVFAFWPFIVLVPIQRRKHILYYMTLAWGFTVLLWAASFFSPVPNRFTLIPEPWNTVLFWLTGVVLIGIQLALRFFRRRNLQIKADKATSAEDLRQLSPSDFENLTVELFTALGHKAWRTGAVGDHGVDVEVKTNKGEKWIVQCKRWRGSVGEPIVRDFYGVIQHEKADQGAIITTGRFTVQAREWAKGKPIRLLEGDDFLKFLKKARAAPRSAA